MLLLRRLKVYAYNCLAFENAIIQHIENIDLK